MPTAPHNVMAFTETLLLNLPAHVGLRLVRADAGFQNDAWLSLLEQKGLRYIVVADLSVRVKSLIRSQKHWQPTGLDGLEVADEIYHSKHASRPRRMIILRRRINSGRGGGKMLFDCPGYQYQALLTSLGPEVAALEVWRDYNGRAQMENVIKELKGGFGLPRLLLPEVFPHGGGPEPGRFHLQPLPAFFAARSVCSAPLPSPPPATASSTAPPS